MAIARLCSALLGVLILGSPVDAQGGLPSRIVFLIMDDVGADTLAQVDTPNIDALALAGLQFRRAYSHPWCKPSRDSLFRGTFAGVARGDSCQPADDRALDADQGTYVDALRAAGYLTGVVGKWHLGRSRFVDGVGAGRTVRKNSKDIPWWFAPHAVGFDHWWGGVSTSVVGPCAPSGNTHDDGVFYTAGSHPTIVQRNALFSLMDEADSLGKPLFAWVGFTDAHAPWSLPPARILPAGYVPPPFPSPTDLYQAEVMALDFVIGQIMRRMPPDAWLVVMSENGTPMQVTSNPATTRAKATVWERGVHVPLIFHGGGLSPGTCDDPVQLYDLPATILDSLGLIGPRGMGRNLLASAPSNPFAYVRNPTPGVNQSRAIIENRYKLIDHVARGLEFYDLQADPLELSPLPLVGADYLRLQSRLDQLPGY